MPEPAIDALPIDFVRHSAALLGVSFELSLERCEFGKRGIWIRRFLALAALEPCRACLRPIALAFTLRAFAATLVIVSTILSAMFAAMPTPMTGRPSRFGWC
jgi:hypothetical protein